MKVAYVIFILILLLIQPIKVSANVNYILRSEDILGVKGVSGNSTEEFSNPNHIFIFNNDLIISDTDNFRIKIINLSNLSLKRIIIPSLKINDSYSTTGFKIFQTVESRHGDFISLIDNSSIIKYGQDGNVTKKFFIPFDKYFSNPDTPIDLSYFSSIGIDNSINEPLLLLKTYSSALTYRTAIYSLNITNLDNLSLLKVSSQDSAFSNIQLDFQYFNLTPVYPEYNPNSQIVTLIQFVMEDNHYVSSIFDSFNFTWNYYQTKSWTRSGVGYWFASNNNLIFDNNFKYSGDLNELNVIGTIKTAVSSLFYDSNTDKVWIADKNDNLVIGISILSINPENSTNTSSDNNFHIFLPLLYLIDFITSPLAILVLFIVIVLLFLFVKKRKMN